MNKEEEKIIVTGNAEPSGRCMDAHEAHMEEWMERIECSVCGRTGSRFYEFSDDERSAYADQDNPPEWYPWDDDHTTSIEWDD